MQGNFELDGRVEIIAHRGFSAAAPENTLVAIERAVDAGADAVEFDLLLTRDDVPVLFHDETLDRTTDGTGKLVERTWPEVQGLDAGSWFDAEFAGEPVPRFDDALRLVGDRLGRVYAEVKGAGTADGLERMVGAVDRTGMGDRTVFIAIDWTVLDRLRALRPSLPIGYIVEEASRTREALSRSEGDPSALLDFRGEILLEEPALAREAVARGVELAAWTIDEPADARRLVELGVPRITTNRVDALVAWKATL